MKTTSKRKLFAHRSGFTLLELLIVISIIAILAAIAFPATSLVMNQARKTAAKQQVAGIVNAIKLYEVRYQVLPLAGTSGEEDIPTDAEFVDVLTGVDKEFNPKEEPFLEGKTAKAAAGKKPARSGFVDEGNGSQSLVDPWGNNYIVRLDADGNNEIDAPGLTEPLRATAICWSYGKPDSASDYKSAADKEPKEWIVSWK